MATDKTIRGHPLLAAVLTVSLGTVSVAPSSAAEPDTTVPSAGMREELELIKEEESVSIAVRHDQPISQAPSNVYVITDEDIRHSGATDIPTVLRRIPGMEVMQTTGADFNVSVRGDNQLVANKLLVMVDGRSIYVDVQGQVVWKLLPVTLPEIKRIEVMKGPASFVYGFNAFDGVINIITKSSDEMKGTTLQFGGGEFGTISSAAIQAGTVGKVGYRLSLGRDQNQQWRNRDALAFRTHKFNLDTRYDLSDQSRLLFSGGLVDANRFDGALSEDVVQADLPAQGYANLAYEHGRFSIRGFWNRYSAADRIEFHPLIAPFLTLTDRFGNQVFSAVADTYNIDVLHSLRFNTSHHFTYGINYRHNTFSGNSISEYSREDRLGLYAQEEWKATEALTLVAGIRYDLHTEIQGTLSPRVAVVYRPAEDHTFLLSGSAAYRPPSLFETKTDLRAVSAPTAVVSGSSNLDPEQIVSYQAGYQGWFLRHRLRVRADLFFNQITNLISARNQTPTLATLVNDPGQADIYGGEAGLEFLATRWLSGFANYSYQEIGQSFTGRVQRGAPRFKWNAGVRGEWDNGLSGEVAYHYVGAATYPPGQSFTLLASVSLVTIPTTRVGSYNLLNLRGAYKFWQERAAAGHKREAEFAVSVFNALNDRHKEHPLGDEIGSRVMGWVTLKF